MAYISDDDIMTHKYPFYACELLRCDAPYIYEKFFENEKIMAYFFDFLNDEKNRSNNVLSGYFTKIFLSLLDTNLGLFSLISSFLSTDFSSLI